MNLKKEEALNLGIQVMSDINFNYDKNAEITIRYLEKGKYYDFNCWLLGFPYGLEDFDRYVYGSLVIDDDLKIVKENISIRNGSIALGYDEESGKYFIKEKRP